MLNVIYGKAGSGKTNYVNNVLASLAREGCEDLLLIVPEQFSFSSEREMLRLLGPVDCNKVEVVMSFSHIAETVRKEYAGRRFKEVSKTQKILLMSMAINAVKDKLEVFLRRASSKGFIEEMIAVCDEFKQNALTTDKVNDYISVVDSSFLKSKLRETALIVDAYNALIENKFTDPFDELTLLYDVLGEYKFFKNKTVVIDGFHSFSRQELKITERIMSQAKDVYITSCVDEKNSENEYDIFAYTRKTLKEICDIADRYNQEKKFIKVETESEKREKEIEFLEENIFRIDKNICEDETENIQIIRAKNIEEEARFVAFNVKKLLAEKNVRARDIAIVSRDGNEYDVEIKEALKKYDVQVFSDKLQSVKIQPLCTYILSALEMCAYGINEECMMKCLKTGLTDLTTDEIARLENYSLMWGRSASFSKEWTENPRGFGEEMLDSDLENLNELNRLREIAVNPILKFKGKLKNRASGRIVAEEIYKLLLNVHADSNLKKIAIELEEKGENEAALLQERIWSLVMEILDSFNEVVGEEVNDIGAVYDLISKIIEKEEIGVLPQGLDEVLVGNAERTRVASPKIVFIVGANDGVFPRTPAVGGIFTQRERNILLESGLHLNSSILDRILEERFIAYHALSVATEKVFVSYVTSNASEEMYASEIVREILGVYPKCRQIDTSGFTTFDYIYSPFTAFESACQTWARNDKKSNSLRKIINENSEYSERIQAVASFAQKKIDAEPIKINNTEIAKKLYGENMRVSASRIETYYKCPFEYFCKFGLKLTVREKAEISPRQRGTVVHYCLEKLIREFGIEELSNLEDEKLKKIIENMLEEYAEISMGGTENKTERFEFLFSKFQKTVYELIKQIIEEFSVSDFEPCGFELKIDYDGDVSPYEIELSDGGKISVRGSVDRVDIMEKDDKKYLRVVDYKTGGKEFNLYEVLEGINMQMLIYLFATTQNGKGIYENCTPAGVLYKPAKFSQLKAERYDSKEDIEKMRKLDGKYSGLVLLNEDVIYGMDKNLSGNIINVKMKEKDEKISFNGSVVSLAHLGKLKNKVDKIVKEMGEELHAGNAEILPYETSNDSACRFCDYSSVCLKQDEDKVRNPHILKNEEIFKIFDEEAETDG